ncbi:hypothetical protein NC652_026126 [Populus alba x Populus x berolinensis]|uniref:Uncharacterized protein n=1 Tax=Populus alba x Populus x berolinensis TaxID=444605 RepID=A0AAD6MCE3_9ROSI|nr:hypothetical protein NC652_026126 [Populus alba x Populus x berolinensis]KAJ6982681.1 hypothetical protein NC653_025708 [Populus alba x Populus x berolinensis]
MVGSFLPFTSNSAGSFSAYLLECYLNIIKQSQSKVPGGRVNLEYSDYSGTGASNRHTPEPPPGLGETD